MFYYTQETLLNGKKIDEQGIVSSQISGDKNSYISAYKNGDVYYAHIDGEGILELLSTPVNKLSLEERLSQNLTNKCKQTRKKKRKRKNKTRSRSRSRFKNIN